MFEDQFLVHVLPSGRRRVLQHVSQHGRITLDVARGPRLGGAYEQRRTECRIPTREIETADDAAGRQRVEHAAHRAIEREYCLVKARSLEDGADTGNPRQRRNDTRLTPVRRFQDPAVALS